MIDHRSISRIIIIVISIMIIRVPTIRAQSNSIIKRNARIFYQKEMLAQAHPYFVQSIKNGKNSCSWLIKASEACLSTNDLEHAIEYLTIIIDKKGNKKPQAIRLLAIALHRNHEFERAITTYKTYLKHTSNKDQFRQSIKYKILQCRNGIKIRRYKNDHDIVENLGPEINNEQNQFGLIQSSLNENRYYYSSEEEVNVGGKRTKTGIADDKFGYYKSDMYKIVRDQGIWSKAIPANSLLNTPLSEAILTLDSEGQALFYYRGLTQSNGQVFVDSFEINQLKSIENKELNEGKTWQISGDKGLYLYRDSILFFASNMKGGYGGFDIYMSILRGRNWSEPVNLGPQVNSPFDEITPYMSRNGRSFYFSSNSTKSIGGYDIFRIEYDSQYKKWKYLKNLGLPINSACDDTHYRGSNDGYQGSITSNRFGGYGQKDLYLIYYERLQKNELTLRDPIVFSSLYRTLYLTQKDLDKAADTEQSIKNEFYSNTQYTRIILESITNTQDDFLSEKKNIVNLEKIISTLKFFPESKIKISGYVNGTGKEYGLIFSSKNQIGQVEDYLLSKGVDSTQIITIGYGNSYPVINTDDNNPSLKNIRNKYNNRIEFFIIHNNPRLLIHYKKLDISTKLLNTKNELLKGLNYKIRLIQSNKVLTSPLISKANKAILRQDGSNSNSFYYISDYKSYYNAKNGIGLLNQRQFENAIVVPFMGNEIIDRQQIIDYSLSFPDLSLYLMDYP